MEDPLAPVGQFLRTVSAVLMTFATFAFIALLLLGISHHISTGSPYYNGRPYWLGTVLFALLTPAAVWMTIRLWSPLSSTTRVTLMPLWFIELYGVFFAAGIVLVAFTSSHPWYALNGLGIAITMILIRRVVRRKLQ